MRSMLMIGVAVAVLVAACDSGEEPDATAPSVVSTNPVNGASAVSVNTDVSVTFNESMDASTVQANYDNTECTETVRLSSDGFATCVRFSGGYATNENRTYTFTPILPLASGTSYQLRITTGAQDVAGNTMHSDYVAAFTTQ